MLAIPARPSPPSALALLLENAVAASAPATQTDRNPADLNPAFKLCVFIHVLHAGTRRELFEHPRRHLDAGNGIREGRPRRA
jgi:hypothetical protein